MTLPTPNNMMPSTHKEARPMNAPVTLPWSLHVKEAFVNLEENMLVTLVYIRRDVLCPGHHVVWCGQCHGLRDWLFHGHQQQGVINT